MELIEQHHFPLRESRVKSIHFCRHRASDKPSSHYYKIIATIDSFPKIQNDNNTNDNEYWTWKMRILISLGRIIQIILNFSFVLTIECNILSFACCYYHELPGGCVSTDYRVRCAVWVKSWFFYRIQKLSAFTLQNIIIIIIGAI